MSILTAAQKDSHSTLRLRKDLGSFLFSFMIAQGNFVVNLTRYATIWVPDSGSASFLAVMEIILS